jgi:hypothetical protein
MSLALIISFLTPGSVLAGGALGAAVSGWTLWTRTRRADERAVVASRTATYQVREEPPVGQVTAFVDWLAERPLREWLELGREIARDRANASARGDAWDRVQSAIADRGMQLAAWYVRDAVETAAFVASHSTRRWSRDDRLLFAAAHGAAESAALALLTRPYLTPEHFSTLYGPFAAGFNWSVRLTGLTSETLPRDGVH